MKDLVSIAIIYSLPTEKARRRRYIASDEDTQESAEEVWQALIDKGASVALYPVRDKDLQTLSGIRADCIFNMLEWDGLDLPLTLEAVRLLSGRGIPFTGSDAGTIEITNNKVRLKEAFRRHGLPTAPWQVFTRGDEDIPAGLKFPVIVKPSLEHCSIGLDADAVVADPLKLKAVVGKKLREFDQPFIVEEFIKGMELQVTVFEKDGQPVVLPPAEIVFYSRDQGEFLTYESRWDEHHADYKRSGVRLAVLDAALLAAVERIALKTFRDLGFRDYSRLDIRIRDGEVYLLEANANPGLGDDDDYGMTVSYRTAGLTFADFVWDIVQSCLRRSGKITRPSGE